MSGLAFSSDETEKLIATYKTPDMERQRDETLRRLGLKPGERVIDIGCGPGFLCESMAVAVGPTGCVVGIDISQDLINFATKQKNTNSIEYRAGNATALPVDAGQFDIAVSTQVIEYVVDVDAALREIARVLRAGGQRLSSSIPTSIRGFGMLPDAERMALIMKGWEMHCADPPAPKNADPATPRGGIHNCWC